MAVSGGDRELVSQAEIPDPPGKYRESTEILIHHEARAAGLRPLPVCDEHDHG
jgi:hypothetical protein